MSQYKGVQYPYRVELHGAAHRLARIWAHQAWTDSHGATFYVLTAVLAMFQLAAWFDISWIRSMSARGEAITSGSPAAAVSALSRRMRSL